MRNSIRGCLGIVATLAVMAVALPLSAEPASGGIGVVVMHGKGGNPGKHVDKLASALEDSGFQVANIEMPWSGRRHYDVDMSAAAAEVSQALDGLRAKGARKVFVTGHSQGGLFAVYYAGKHKVDGVVAIAPGGQVDANAFVSALGGHVAQARKMVDEGRGGETATFADHEGSRGTSPVTTTAAIYLDWFNPEGAHTSRAFKSVMDGVPVLYVAPTRDYPGLKASKQRNFTALPSHRHTRLYEPDADHMKAPTAAAGEIAAWIRQVAAE